MILRSAVVLVLLTACATPKPSADSAKTADATAIDTVKPAAATMQPPIDTTTPSPPATKRASATSATSATTKATRSASRRDTAHLGRDSVIRNNPRDPRFQIPAVPPKKPPQ